MPSYLVIPTPPLPTSYRRTELMHLPGGSPAAPPYIEIPTAPPAVFPSWCTSLIGLYHTSLTRHGKAAPGRPLPVDPVGVSPRRGPCHDTRINRT